MTFWPGMPPPAHGTPQDPHVYRCRSAGERRAVVSAVRHAVTVPADPLSPLPRLPLRSLAELAKCAEEIHSDRCRWMGGDASHPCTCEVPRAIRMLAAVWADPSNPPAPGTSA